VVIDAVWEQGSRSARLEARGDGGGPLEARLWDRVAAVEEGAMLAVMLIGEVSRCAAAY